MSGFVRAATDGDEIGRDAGEARRRRAKMVKKRKASGFFDARLAGAQAPIGKRARRDACGALVFLPNAHFHRKLKLFPQPPFFESWHDQDGLASFRDEQPEQAFAEAPADAGEVIKRRARRDEQDIERGLTFRHALLRLRHAGAKFFGLNGMDAIGKRPQICEWGWEC